MAPFLLVCGWRAWPRPTVRRGLAVGAALFAALVLPFVVWGPADFFDDIYRFNAGLSRDSYPLGGTPGFGFAMLAAVLRWAPDPAAYYDLTPYLLLTALPLTALLLARLLHRPTVAQAMLAAFLVSFWVFFFSRVFNNNYFGVLAFLLQMGALAAAEETLLPAAAPAPPALAELDDLLARMQTPKARQGMVDAFNATPARLGKAAVAAAKKRG